MVVTAIDCEVHNDWILACDDESARRKTFWNYTDIRHSMAKLPLRPRRDFFVGSKSAWLPWSAFDEGTYRRQGIPFFKFGWLYIAPLLVMALPALAVLLLV